MKRKDVFIKNDILVCYLSHISQKTKPPLFRCSYANSSIKNCTKVSIRIMSCLKPFANCKNAKEKATIDVCNKIGNAAFVPASDLPNNE